jgi:hypothetical protein
MRSARRTIDECLRFSAAKGTGSAGNSPGGGSTGRKSAHARGATANANAAAKILVQNMVNPP